MRIQDLFARDIHRSINGVVKADQLDQSSVWQELDEFVVTTELTRHVTDIVSALNDPSAGDAGRNGVWISGFFGSGKSHFLKVLSYVLQNEVHEYEGKRCEAADFFKEKLGDALLFADLKKAASVPTDAILFNIDSKADAGAGRDAILQVFLKVLNERQGYCGDHPHIAHMERFLDGKQLLDKFHEAFLEEAGEPWIEERDAWSFHRDHVITALQSALGQSQTSVEKWVDSGSSSFSLTVENFAKWAMDFLERKGDGHRLMFLVDEVGQFIGTDTHLMLSLQTITEQLGTVCGGRAWVVVTSQEDLDSALGELKATNQQDFSKIQGRFTTRLSLSSSNVDEVIRVRLLQKKASADEALLAAYRGKEDILKNQLSFMKAGMSFKSYEDEGDFCSCYPFPAYQFSLVQKVFESIRKVGATGRHLSQGERSTLDAFQGAAMQMSSDEIGVLAPFSLFYPAVEGFLDSKVKRTITHAGENKALEEFDANLLKILFLIRYVDEMPGSVDNLITLCVGAIDEDCVALRSKIEDSLARLERETLVSRDGDLYYFLTDEERDIEAEIRNVSLPAGEESRELGKILFEEVLNSDRKHRFAKTGKEFLFNRWCDDYSVGNRQEGALEVYVVSPLGEEFDRLADDAACIMDTAANSSRVLIRLPESRQLPVELRAYLQVDAYVRKKGTAAIPETTKRILRDRAEENRRRRQRIVELAHESLAEAGWFISGNKKGLDATNPRKAVGEALEYLIGNTFSKMHLIEESNPDPDRALQALLRSNDLDRLQLEGGKSGRNPKALDELRNVVKISAERHREVLLSDLVHKRFSERPFGWPEKETLLLVGQLAVLKEVDLLVGGVPLQLNQAYEHLTAASKQRKVVLVQRVHAAKELIADAQQLGKTLFAVVGPADEDELAAFLRQHVSEWNEEVAHGNTVAASGRYPGAEELSDATALLGSLLEGSPASAKFLERFVDRPADLLEVREDLKPVLEFFRTQKPTWDGLLESLDRFEANRRQLEAVPESAKALARMREIREAKHPYGEIYEVPGLIERVRAVNDRLMQEARDSELPKLNRLIEDLEEQGKALGLELDQSDPEVSSLLSLRDAIDKAPSVAHITQAVADAERKQELALSALETKAAKVRGDGRPVPPPRKTVELRALAASPILTTEEEVAAFVEAVRAELLAALKSGSRVHLK